MKRILFSVGINAVEALGSVTRMIAIADEVIALEPDTKILFRAAGSEAEHVKKHGYITVSGYKPNIMGFSAPAWKLISSLQGEWNGKVSDLKRMDDIVRLKGIFTKKYVDTTYAEWVKLIEEFAPDAIVSEFDLMSLIVARKFGLPVFTTVGMPCSPEYYYDSFYNAPSHDKKLCTHYNNLLKSIGMPKIASISELFMGYDYAYRLIPSIPSLEGFAQDDKTYYTGSIVPNNFCATTWSWDKKRPLIFVYLSVGQITAQLAEEVLISAFAQSDFDVIVVGAGNPYFEKRGEHRLGNVNFYSYLPTETVMKMADIVIHHGGQNTTLQCIEAQVPALIFPGRHFERHFNGRKAAEANCAYCLTNENFNPETLKKLCFELYQNRPFSKSLRLHSEEIKSYGGKRRAAEIVLTVTSKTT